MRNLIKPAAALAVAVSLAACQQQGSDSGESDEVALDTPTSRLSYGVALGLGRNMANDGMEVDVEAFAAGLSDAMSGAEPRLSQEEIRAEMLAFQERANSELEAAREAAAAANAAEAAEFFAENGAREGVMTTDSGLQYEALEEGEGPKPTAEDRVQVHYRGTLLDGTVFDSSYERGQPVTFGLNQVIPGWTEGLQLMSPGAKYKLYIPSELGYGSGGAGDSIGPNAALIFEVELLSIPTQEAAAQDEGSEG